MSIGLVCVFWGYWGSEVCEGKISILLYICMNIRIIW